MTNTIITTKDFTSEEHNRLYNHIVNYPSVANFLEKKGRNSKSTPIIYHTGLTYFEKFLQDKYMLTIDNVIPKLKKHSDETFNVYTVIRDFVKYLIYDLKKTTPTVVSSMRAVK